MGPKVLVKDDLEAGYEFVRAFDLYAPVLAAFWLRGSDVDDRPALYIAYDPKGGSSADGYKEVVRLSPTPESLFFDTFSVKLIAADTPLAKTAIAMNERFIHPSARRLGPQLFGGRFIEDGYLYPPLHPVAAAG